MDPQSNDPLEQSLKNLTWWSVATPGVWKKALRSAQTKSQLNSFNGLTRMLLCRWSLIGVPVATAIVIAVCLATRSRQRDSHLFSDLSMNAAVSPATSPAEPWKSVSDGRQLPLGKPNTTQNLWTLVRSGDNPLRSFVCASSADGENREASPHDFWDFSYNLSLGDSDGDGVVENGRGASLGTQSTGRPGSIYSPSASAALTHTGATDRHVIRKALVDLQQDDIRGTYLKILALLPNESTGEYVEQSQIYDNAGQLYAYIMLRVRGERINDVISTLRGLATVVKEQIDAYDATSQVVDTEARLRNERRVEQELLDLLEKRKDSPLEDILKVSQSLAEVRGRIESLVAQQQQLSRQVALATVVVSIQSKPKVEPPTQATGLLDHIGARFGNAWRDGASFLIDTLAGFVRVFIGGLLWWLFLFVVLWFVQRWYRRSYRNQGATGPAGAQSE